MEKKVLLTATVQSHIALFHRNLADLLHENGFEVHVAASNDLAGKDGLAIDFADKIFDVPFSRSPFNPGNMQAYKQLKEIINGADYQVIHCNTPVGSILTRLAARKARKKGSKVIYTAHGFHFYKGAPLKNWIYYPIEKLCSRWTDVLITINKEDYTLACNKMKAKKVEYIPGVGIDTNKFINTAVDRNKKRKELRIPDDAFVLTSVGELNNNKNHAVIINALSEIDSKNNIHYIIVGQGALKDYLLELARKNGISDKVHLLGFRNDVSEIYKSSDVCVLPSIREGLAMAAIEGMACGLPIIASNNRGSKEYLNNGINGFACEFDDTKGFADAILKLYNDLDLRLKMGTLNTELVKKFDIEQIKKQMKKVYQGFDLLV